MMYITAACAKVVELDLKLNSLASNSSLITAAQSSTQANCPSVFGASQESFAACSAFSDSTAMLVAEHLKAMFRHNCVNMAVCISAYVETSVEIYIVSTSENVVHRFSTT